MAETVRTPRQRRSIDKKKRIIEAGYALFAQKGYYSTNTAEIAKEAGVSTGIVYGYFRDKRDILIEVMDIYVEQVFRPVLEMFDKLTPPLDFDFILKHAVDSAVKTHKQNAAIHEALHSLSHTDEAVRLRFIELEDEMTERVAERLNACGIALPDAKERVHLAKKTVESYAHECVYDKHSYLSYPDMRILVVEMLKGLFVGA